MSHTVPINWWVKWWVEMANLTDLHARNLKPGGNPVADGTVTGLTLKPGTKKGHGNWELRFTSPLSGKRRAMGLGTYPEIKIEEARKIAIASRELIAKGKDPIDFRDEEKNAKSAVSRTITFEEAARKKYAEKLPSWKNGKHIAQWITTLEAYVFPHIGAKDVATLKASDFADALRPIWFDKPETASRVRQRCHDTMKWACAHEYVTSNPVDMVTDILGAQPSKSDRVTHQPSMPWTTIPAFVRDVLRGEEDRSRVLLEFVILTAARSGEARGAVWSEIDLQNMVWTIPAERMKRKKPHRVPLSQGTVKILKKQKENRGDSELVFPSVRGKVLTDILRRHNVESSEPGRTATAHGFRSSFRDWCSENGYARDLAERALAHGVKDKTEAAYHRTDLLEERRPMMEAWSSYVTNFDTHVSALANS